MDTQQVSHMQWFCYTCGRGGTAFAKKMKLRVCFHIMRSHIIKYGPVFTWPAKPSASSSEPPG